MTDKERRIVEKLQALIKDTPYAGEKATAISVLKNYCLKHGIEEWELNSNHKQTFEYVIRDNIDNPFGEYNLFEVIARHFYERQNENFWEQGHRYYQKNKKTLVLLLEMTSEDFVNLIAEYEFYKKAFNKSYKKAFEQWQRDYFRAFLMKQDLLFDADPNKEIRIPTEEEIEREQRVISMTTDIKKVDFYKQLEAKD